MDDYDKNDAYVSGRASSKISVAVVIAMSWISSAAFCSRALAQDDLLSETVAQLERSHSSQSVFTVTWTRSAVNNPAAPPPMTWHVTFDGKNFWESWQTPAEVAVLAWNENYAFQVAKPNGSETWMTRDIVVGQNTPDRTTQRARADEMFRDPHLRVDSFLLKDLLQRHLQSTSARKVVAEGMTGVELKILPSSPETNRFFPDGVDRITAVVGFDPCRVISYELASESRVLTGRNADFSVANDIGDITFVRHERDDHRSDPAGPMISESRYAYAIQPGKKHEEAKYTLTGYGLPEPPALRSAGSYRTQPWLYYFFGGVLCVAVGAFFIHRVTRKSGRA